jgi:hypothetical protein
MPSCAQMHAYVVVLAHVGLCLPSRVSPLPSGTTGRRVQGHALRRQKTTPRTYDHTKSQTDSLLGLLVIFIFHNFYRRHHQPFPRYTINK